MVIDALDIFVERRRLATKERQEKALAFFMRLEELRDRLAEERAKEPRGS